MHSLNKHRRKELLEVATKLYPEHHVKYSEINPSYLIGFNKDKNAEFSYHWFEFCWVALNKISENERSPINISKDTQYFGMICFNRSDLYHPIDFIYKKYYEINKK